MVIVLTTGKDPLALIYITTTLVPLQGLFNLCIYMYPKIIRASRPKRGHEKVPWCQAISAAFRSRGKARMRNRPRMQTSDLRTGRNRPLEDQDQDPSV